MRKLLNIEAPLPKSFDGILTIELWVTHDASGERYQLNPVTMKTREISHVELEVMRAMQTREFRYER